MSELKVYVKPLKTNIFGRTIVGQSYYLKSEADEVIAEKDAEIAQLQAMLEERNKQVGELKDRIAPKQSDKTLQERLNEVCKKHGVSTLQDLDWAFCKSEKKRTRDCIEAVKELRHHKYKRCLAMAEICRNEWCTLYYERKDYLENRFLDHLMAKKDRHKNIWLKLAEKFKPNNSTAQ